MEPLLSSATAAPAAPADTIKDSSTAGFRADVMEASMTVPVIVDFWAPWCGPCKQLGPMLEKAVKAARGKVRMVKINVDENQQLAGQLRIQSIPTVYAFYQGQPVDGFAGAQPESQVKAFVEKLLALAGQQDDGAAQLAAMIEQAEAALKDEEFEQAGAMFGQLLQMDSENPKIVAGLARALIGLGRTDDAQQFLGQVPEEIARSQEVAAVRTLLDLASQTAGAAADEAGLADLMEKVAHDHNDHQARFDLAMALFGRGKREAAVDELLEIVRRDRAWNEDAARKQLVTFFEAFGPTDPLTLSARRRLSSILFS